MQTLTIEAVSQESALGLYAVLSAFRTELVEMPEGTYHVEIALGGSDREIVDVLNVLERHVTSRRAGPARLALNGRSYVLHGAPGLAEDESRPFLLDL
jgi:hypothetical protein